jgi:uncharacterized protein
MFFNIPPFGKGRVFFMPSKFKKMEVKVLIINQRNEKVIAHHVIPAYTFWRRLKGLMFRKSLPADYAMHIKPCSSIHTFFMKFPLDVLYIDENNQVVKVSRNIPPGKMEKVVKKAQSVIEMPAGSIEEAIEVGDKIQIKK